MKTETGPERVRSLVVELAARTAIIDGVRIELPPTEFDLLVAFAARPGQVVTHKEITALAFGEGASVAPHELHWRIWKLRDVLGDGVREHKMIENRRGQGYVLDMPASAVEVVDGVAAIPNTQEVIRLDQPEEAATDDRSTSDAPFVTPVARPSRRVRFTAVLSGTAIALAALGTSWTAGYLLSRAQGDNVPMTEGADPQPADEPGDQTADQGRNTRDRQPDRRKGPRDSNPGGAVVAGGPSGSSSTAAEYAPTVTNQNDGTGGDNRQEAPAPPPPPQPDAQLYHLVSAETGDHIMTTSSSVANQKQAEGYEATLEGGVFTTQEKGTIAISLDSGTAYVYGSSSSAPDGVSVAALYRLSSADDFFYTTSSSAANQAQAQGWTRSTAGYVTS